MCNCLPGVSETSYCQIHFISVDKCCQSRSTDCAQSLKLNKGSATPAIHHRVDIGIGIIVFTVGYDNVAGAVNIEACHITGTLSRDALYLNISETDTMQHNKSFLCTDYDISIIQYSISHECSNLK